MLPFDDVSFSYSGKPEDYLYKNLNLAVDYDSRIALVMPHLSLADSDGVTSLTG